MIITLKNNAPIVEINKLKQDLETYGIKTIEIENTLNLFLVGDVSLVDDTRLLAYQWVEKVTRIAVPYKLASRLFHPHDTIVSVGNIRFGGNENIVIIGGPCSVESERQIDVIANGVSSVGGKALRGGAYKPRTSPYAFQGLRSEGIDLLHQAGKKYNLPIVSEITSTNDLDEFVEKVDIIQVGARNMQNFELLKALGKTKKPILLKRGLANTVEEWLLSAEYILAGGNPNVILCERGIRTYEKSTRNTLDLSVVPVIKEISHLPIIVDPSHGTGKWNLVEPMSLAAIAAGADGLLIEVHNDPIHALSDGGQSLKIKNFEHLIHKGRKIAQVLNRDI